MPGTFSSVDLTPSAAFVLNQTAQSQVTATTQVVSQESRFSKNFINSEPKILFVSEYGDKNLVGCLVVWEKFLNATHYEIFKRNLFAFNSKFERILFLDANSLQEETKQYMNYINQVIGFSSLSEQNIFAILDTFIKEDRIYEYKIKASFVPNKVSDIEYDSILEGKDLLKKTDIFPRNIFDFSLLALGNPELAWIVSLVNENLGFFGRNSSGRLLTELTKNSFVFVPKNINDVFQMFGDSVSLFGLKQTFSFILEFLEGLTSDIISIAANSVDVEKGTFSFDKFKTDIQSISPLFSLILSTSSSDKITELAKISVIIPQNSGSVSLFSIEGLTTVFNFINNVFLAASYTQENFEAAKNILDSTQASTSNSQLAQVQATSQTANTGV
ncbi:MAG: hypothetical protein AABY22_21715, partial [Nanoarchaeota archaeon]